mmetsp:Transcript_16258/g.19856  ORF Transcript_16258/g.19856 Transcript_16258/m.19856 type:complete len:238 (+) Transcript_16258:226-939(+)
MSTVIPFSRYNEEFSSLVSQTRQTLSSLSSTLEVSTESQSSSSSKLERDMNLALNLLNQTKDLLKQMTVEARSSSVTNSNQKEECLKIVRIAKANHANLKDDVNGMQSQVEHHLLMLQNSSSKNSKRHRNNNGVNGEVRQHLLDTNSNLSNQNSTLDRAKQVMAETEVVALEITEELSRNRETIESAHSRVRGVSSLTNQARRVLVNMQRREVQQKMVVYGVGVILFLALLFLLGFF